MYRTFIRTWWVDNPRWPNGLEPCPGKKRYLAKFDNETDARHYAKSWNRIQGPERTAKQIRLSLKCEYESY